MGQKNLNCYKAFWNSRGADTTEKTMAKALQQLLKHQVNVCGENPYEKCIMGMNPIVAK